VGIRVILALSGIFVGITIIALAWNNRLGQAWNTITGSPASSSDSSTATKSPTTSRPVHRIPGEESL
jgi:cytoskeletal protein RodZ